MAKENMVPRSIAAPGVSLSLITCADTSCDGNSSFEKPMAPFSQTFEDVTAEVSFDEKDSVVFTTILQDARVSSVEIPSLTNQSIQENNFSRRDIQIAHRLMELADNFEHAEFEDPHSLSSITVFLRNATVNLIYSYFS